jgi:hypothetical protein
MNKYVYAKIGVYYFSAEHAAIRRKREDWLVRNQDNVSEWCDISFAYCCFSELATKRVGLVQNYIIISLKTDLFSP